MSVCDELGICRSLAMRTLTNKFSNAFVTAAKAQSLTESEHAHNIKSAYAKWSTPKVMFEAADVTDVGWKNI